jgi:predicted amidohydrolase
MARQAADQNLHLDLAILPETVVTSTQGPAEARAIPLDGPARDAFADLARKHRTYIIASLDLAEPDGDRTRYVNAAVLFDREGSVAGIYRKRHPVATPSRGDLEGGITPGREAPVFDCDFGKLGVQICWDIQFPDGWDALARSGAEIVAWPSASPATVLPATRAADHRYYVVSSTWRDNATIYEPTGMVAARVEGRDKVLVAEIDLSYAIHGWAPSLGDGEALRARFGDRVGFHYSNREDMGLFWSNDPAMPIGSMIRSIGGEELDAQVARNRRLHDDARGEP